MKLISYRHVELGWECGSLSRTRLLNISRCRSIREICAYLHRFRRFTVFARTETTEITQIPRATALEQRREPSNLDANPLSAFALFANVPFRADNKPGYRRPPPPARRGAGGGLPSSYAAINISFECLCSRYEASCSVGGRG